MKTYRTWHSDWLQCQQKTLSLPLYTQNKYNTTMTSSSISSSSESLCVCVFEENKSLQVKLLSDKIINSAAKSPKVLPLKHHKLCH